MSIFIRNKLEVLPGNKIIVPLCEPTSATSSTTLAENRKEFCNGSVVGLADALEAIPGSTIEFMTSFGGHKRILFVLPDGPAPNGRTCPPNKVEDHYKLLRDIGQPIDLIKTITEVDITRESEIQPPGVPFVDLSASQVCEVFPIKNFKRIF